MSAGIIIGIILLFVIIGIAAAFAFSGSSSSSSNTGRQSLGVSGKIKITVQGDWQQYESSIKQACEEVSALFNDNIELPILFIATTGSKGGTIAAAIMENSSQIYSGGYIRIYTDYPGIPNSGYKEVLIHEILHVMGIGSHNKWQNAILTGGLLDGNIFTNALSIYKELTGDTDENIPIDTGHWRESTFGDEMMTPYVNGETDLKLSKLTGAALKDLSWDINLTIPPFEDYSLPS